MDLWIRRTARVLALVALIGLAGTGVAASRLSRSKTALAATPAAYRLTRSGTRRTDRGLIAKATPATPTPAPVTPAPVTPPQAEPPKVDQTWTYADAADPVPVPTAPAAKPPEAAAPSAGSNAPAPKAERIPVLMYHEIGDVENGNYVSRSDFEAEIKWLSENGYHTVTLGEVYRHINDFEPLPSKPIVLTFDDGYQTFAEIVVPVLKPYGFRATTFIITGSVGKREFMTWEQVKALPESGVEIGSHTVNHLDLRTLSAARLRQELEDSKKELEEKTGVKVEFFCYPSGRYNDTVAAAAKAAGYLAAVTTEYGPVTADESAFLWSRIRISRGESLKAFASKVNQASGQ